ncbi:molybdopterin-dependent oxidoreductase [Mucilaginibacter sp.]|uniref:molybdopterin-dependent oxidoreductase n=1 Tax=Mucilaginibacter sp. TaxID=1882438 RepID=UPI0025F937A1|nr:molybdopterin-dependent oxidoreductase [Mucilaginibacter sp.]
MKSTVITFLCIAILFITSTITKAQVTAPNVKITGEVSTPLDIKLSDLQLYSQVQVKYKDKDGNYHNYSGVVLADILQKAGVPLGKELHGKNLAKFVVAEGSDGYQAVFALAELDKGFTDRLVIIAVTIDSKPLSPTEGPFRIIVQDEKKQARCVRMVRTIKVESAK